jgi:hypothetical protein
MRLVLILKRPHTYLMFFRLNVFGLELNLWYLMLLFMAYYSPSLRNVNEKRSVKFFMRKELGELL